jgi:hypothetical protein
VPVRLPTYGVVRSQPDRQYRAFLLAQDCTLIAWRFPLHQILVLALGKV